MYGQRYYLACYDSTNAIVFNVAVITSPAAKILETIAWSSETLQVAATTTLPHGFMVGSMVDLVIEGSVPTTYDGAFICLVTSTTGFTYPLTIDPGLNVASGSASWQVNLCEGYFTTSSIVYRNNQFEVSP